MPPQVPVPCVILRGGTSKGVFFAESDLPADAARRDRLIQAVMGSGDPRQIDGLGGADHLTSKIAIIGPGAAYGADVTYTFGQVGIDQPYVSYSGNCGNLSAAVGVYAIEAGHVAPREPVTTVRIYSTNARQMLLAHVPVAEGRPQVEGDYAIAGVPGTGAEIRMDYSGTQGATTGRVLPTGNPRDELYVAGLGRKVAISIVDVAKATCYFHAAEVGLRGNETPEAFTPEVLARCWSIRDAAAEAIGLRPEDRLPLPVAVAAPMDSIDFTTGRTVAAVEMSFCARRVVGPPPKLHKAFASTGAVCTAAAAFIPGTVVHEVCTPPTDHVVRIGHPSGVFPVRLVMNPDGGLAEASYSRTARRLMEGTVYVPASVLGE